MNSSVTVTGMTIRTQVSDNLLIAPAENTANTNAPATTMPAANRYGTALITPVDVLLEPVSSVSGLYNSFFYTDATNVVTSGDAKSNAYIAYPASPGTANALDDFNHNYGTTDAVGYVDYVFALQATNTSKTNQQKLNMTKCQLTYNGTADDATGFAYRVAVLVQQAEADGSAANATATTLTVLGCTDGAETDPTVSQYFGANGESHNNEAIIAATGTTHGTVGTYGTAATIDTLATQGTKYYKVTVRIWLEGEDTTCNNATYALLDSRWALDLKFALENAGADGNTATNPVTAIKKVTRTLYSITNAAAANAGNDIVIDGITYHQFTATGGTIYSTDTAAATNSRWFTITGSKEIYEVTKFVTVANS